MKNNLLISLIVLALIGGAVYFSLNKSQTATTTPEATSVSPTSAEASPTGEAIIEEVTEIVVKGKAFEFTPDTITVKKGQKTRIVFKNTGGMHDFNVDELGIKTKIVNTGEEDFSEFTPTEAGTYEFYCSVGNHRQMGMVGTLIIEE
jgi:plastocyanin